MTHLLHVLINKENVKNAPIDEIQLHIVHDTSFPRVATLYCSTVVVIADELFKYHGTQ